jgi:hypothetical protein
MRSALGTCRRASSAPANANGSANTVCLKRTSPSRAGTSASPAAGDDAREEAATRAILPPVAGGRRPSAVAGWRAVRPLLAALAVVLGTAAAASAAKAPEPPPNPDVFPRVVGQGVGRFLDAQMDGAVVSWVADPGPGLPRAILISTGSAAWVSFEETVRGPGALSHRAGFPVPLTGVEAAASSGIAAAIDTDGVRVATLTEPPGALYAVASQAPLSAPLISAPVVVASGAAAGLVVRPGGVLWNQAGSLHLFQPSVGAARQIASLPPGASAEGADVSGSTVVYAVAAKGRSTLVRLNLADGRATALLSSPGLLQGPAIAGGWAAVRERRAFGPAVVDRIVAVNMASRRRIVVLQRFDTRAGRVFLDPPRADGNRIVVVQTYSRDALGDLVLHPSAAAARSGLRSSVRVITLPGGA